MPKKKREKKERFVKKEKKGRKMERTRTNITSTSTARPTTAHFFKDFFLHGTSSEYSVLIPNIIFHLR